MEKKEAVIIMAGKSIFVFALKGAMHIGWKHAGVDIIPLLKPKEEGSASMRGGAPICMPFFGASPAGMEDIPQHGWLRDQYFAEPIITKNTKGEQVVTFTGSGGKHAQYPWELAYIVEYTCSEQSVRTTVHVARLDDGLQANAPIGIALHPYFSTVDGKAAKVGSHVPTFSDDFYDIPLSKDDKILLPTKAGNITMDTDNADIVRVWSDAPEQYYCVEPVMEAVEHFNTPKGTTLAIGEESTLGMTLTLA